MISLISPISGSKNWVKIEKVYYRLYICQPYYSYRPHFEKSSEVDYAEVNH